jgi:peptidyl-prolyl cis-trans isomerase B (cyclophilin B)
VDGEEVAVVETKFGRIVFRFFEDKAPKNCANIKKLAKEGFFNGTKFHRTIKGFMIQGGDPNTKTSNKASYGTGGPGYNTPDEFNEISHQRGILSMANSGTPNSGGSQFFMVQGDSFFLDTKYTVFGRICFDGTEKPGAEEPAGLAVVDKIVALPTEGPQKDLAVNPIAMTMAIKKWPLK